MRNLNPLPQDIIKFLLKKKKATSQEIIAALPHLNKSSILGFLSVSRRKGLMEQDGTSTGYWQLSKKNASKIRTNSNL